MRLRGPLAGEVRARTLHGLVVGLLLYIWIVHIPVIVPLFVAREAGSTLANLYLTLIYGITLALLRRGSLRRASLVFLAGTWVAASVFVVFGGGIQSAALVHYVNLPILAAWLLGASAAGVMTAVCLGGSLLLAVLEQSGHALPHYFPGAPFSNWSSVAMATLGTVVPVLYVLSALNEALEGRKGAEEGLRQANEKLEQRVRDRTAQLEEANHFLEIHLGEQKRLEAGLELAARFPGENPNPVMRLGHGHLVDFANPAAQALLRTLGCDVAGEAPAHIAEPAVAALKDGVPRQIEKTYSDRTYLFSLAPIPQWGYVNLYATDITDRKWAEEALQESESRERARAAEFEALMEAAPVGIFVSKDTECRSMSGNRAAYDLLRRPRGSNLSKSGPEGEKPANFRAMKDGKEIPLPELPMQKAAASGKAVRDHEMDFVFEDGVTVNILGNVVPLLDESGRPRGAVGTFLDITERKRAEDALRESEGRFRGLSEAMPQIVWTAEATGARDYYNPRALEYAGASPSNLTGWNWTSIIHPEDREATLDAWRQAVATGQIHKIEHRMRRADGEFRWHLTRAVPLRNDQGAVIQWIGTATEIHDQKMAEQELERRVAERAAELRESQALMKSIVDSTSDLIWSVDHQHFGLLTFNSGLRDNLLQRGIHLQTGMRPEDVFADKNLAERWRAIYQRALTEGPFTADYDSSTAGSMVVTVNLLKRAGEVYGISVFAKDITERVRAEKALQESEEAFRALAESMPQMVWMCTPDGLNVYFNQRWVDYTGLSLEESYGRGWNTPFHPDDKQPAWQAWNHAVETGDTYNIECRLRRADGIYRWFLTRGVPLRDSTGNVVKWFGTCTDIDDLKRAEAELHRLNRALRALSATDQAMVRAQDESELLQETCRILVEEGGYRMAWVGLAEQHAGKTVRPVAHAGTEEGYLKSLRITWADTARGRGPTGTAIRTCQPSVCQNMLEDPRIAPWREEAARRGFASSCALPLCVDGKSIGALTVYSLLPEAFDTAEAELLAQLGADLAFGVEALRTRAERHRAMETLEKNSAQLAEQARLLELAPVAVLVRDLESRVTYWNRGAEEIYGWTSAEASGKVTHKLLQTKFPEPFSEMEAKIFSGVPWQGELTHHKRTGEEAVVVSRQVLRRDKQGNPTGYLEINLDISTRKQAEEALKAERQRFFAVLETLPPMICLLTPDYHVDFANRAFRERFGESEGRRCYDYCFGRPSPCEFCETYNVLKTGQPHHWEVNTPDGSAIDVYDFPFTDVDGAPMILEMDIDITEAKRATEAVEKANAYNRSLLEASLDPLVTISPNGKITDVNSAAEKVTGRLREELIGADFSDCFTDPEKARLGYQQVFKEGLVQDYELEVRRRDGSTTPVLYNASVYRDQGGGVVGVFAAARDITTRKRAEEDVRRLNEELEQRVRLRTAQLEASNKELESFSYSVSHDLRAPLRAMDGFSRILLEEYRSELPSKAQRYLDFVREGASHMGNLIDGLLALSRLGRQELKRRPVEVAEIVRQSMDDLKADAEGSSAEFVVGSLPSCDADPLLLRQVFVNLLSNALKFSRKQEKVRIEVGALRAPEAAQAPEPVRRLLDPHSWVYFVRDNGVGFDMRYADKLFGVFQRLHRQEDFKGTGIGLATVQQIIHRHGGRVWAEAEVGKGATFYFTVGETMGETNNSHSGSPE